MAAKVLPTRAGRTTNHFIEGYQMEIINLIPIILKDRQMNITDFHVLSIRKDRQLSVPTARKLATFKNIPPNMDIETLIKAAFILDLTVNDLIEVKWN